MENINDILEGNKAWVENTLARDPNFFNILATGQSPQYLWIGCSDSRVPASEITNQLPGSIFVQRNIANQVNTIDINMLSVAYYAIKYLKVKHILIVGHYGCGGVIAAMQDTSFGFLDSWLNPIKNNYQFHKAELDALDTDEDRSNRMVELNVIKQVENFSKISFVQEEWANGELPVIHGLVYSLKDGYLKNLNVSTNSVHKLPEVFHLG